MNLHRHARECFFIPVQNERSQGTKVQTCSAIYTQIHAQFQSYFNWDGQTYKFLQFHFHTGSEHTVNGRQAAAEVHFVHQNVDGKLLVIGVLIEAGSSSAEFLRTIASNTKADPNQPTKVTMDWTQVSVLLESHKLCWCEV